MRALLLAEHNGQLVTGQHAHGGRYAPDLYDALFGITPILLHLIITVISIEYSILLVF